MFNPEETLVDFGLTKNEAKVYLELLSMGHTAAGEIAKRAKLHRTNVYDALERLIEKGLVAYVIKDSTKLYQASNPENLMNLLKQKEASLKATLPHFLLNYDMSQKSSKACIYEGMPAVRNILEKFLTFKQPIYVFGIPKHAPEMMGAFIGDYHKRRQKEKIQMNHIYNEDAKERIDFLNNMPYTAARHLQKDYDSLISTNVCGGAVALFVFTKVPWVVYIENKDIADAYKKYFDLLWSVAKS